MKKSPRSRTRGFTDGMATLNDERSHKSLDIPERGIAATREVYMIVTKRNQGRKHEEGCRLHYGSTPEKAFPEANEAFNWEEK